MRIMRINLLHRLANRPATCLAVASLFTVAGLSYAWLGGTASPQPAFTPSPATTVVLPSGSFVAQDIDQARAYPQPITGLLSPSRRDSQVILAQHAESDAPKADLPTLPGRDVVEAVPPGASQPAPAPQHPLAGPPSSCLSPGPVVLRPPVHDPLGPVLPPAPRTSQCQDMETWAPAGTGPSLYFGQGKYVNPERTQHVPVYRLRPEDRVECVFRITRDETSTPYELNVGDQVRIESLTDRELNRDLEILNDGTITLRLLGRVQAARQTVDQLRETLERRYKEYYRNPEISVTPLRVNTRLQDIINSVDSRAGLTGGQVREVRVTPDGSIALPAIGSVPAQGMTLAELKYEIDARYRMVVQGLEITPILIERAPRYVFVLGEVRVPGRYVLEGPTTVMQALALAGGTDNIAATRLRKIVVFRRDQNWRLVATTIDLWKPVTEGQNNCVQDLWLADSDVVLVPKSAMRIGTEYISEIFTRGIYGVMPFQGVSMNFSKLSTL